MITESQSWKENDAIAVKIKRMQNSNKELNSYEEKRRSYTTGCDKKALVLIRKHNRNNFEKSLI
jgi:hypothetical protein